MQPQLPDVWSLQQGTSRPQRSAVTTVHLRGVEARFGHTRLRCRGNSRQKLLLLFPHLIVQLISNGQALGSTLR